MTPPLEPDPSVALPLPGASALARLAAGRVPMEPLVPEASARRYLRLRDPEFRGWLLVLGDPAPPLETAAWLAERGVRVPRLGPPVAGGYLVEDLGDRHLAGGAPAAAWEALLAAGRRIWTGRLPADHPACRHALDAALFRRELALFLEVWPPAGPAPPPEAGAELAAECAALAEAAAAGPRALQHRDFHSRNVLLLEEGGIALLDHQDLRPGPLLYDLASLATDAYTEPPPALLGRLEAEAVRLAGSAGLPPAAARRALETVALQRVLKALGTFGRLLRRGRDDYREPARRALFHARRLLAGRPDLPALRRWLR